MVRTGMWFIVGVVLLWAGIVQAGPNQLLNGDYAFTGEASCLVSNTGFNTDLTPQDGRFVVSFSVHGVRTFNGDAQERSKAAVSASPILIVFQSRLPRSSGVRFRVTSRHRSRMTSSPTARSPRR